jgi:hypothetical protein
MWRRLTASRRAARSSIEAIFDADWYRRTGPADGRNAQDPLGHYIQYGAPAGLDPNPFFRGDWYSKQVASDTSHRDASRPTLHHYIEEGARSRSCPSPLFDPSWYLDSYPDVVRARLDPLVHFLKYGRAEGRLPSRHFRPIQSARLTAHELVEPLASDFEFSPEDFLGYIPNYTVPRRIYGSEEPMFFTAPEKWWTTACQVRPIADLIANRSEDVQEYSGGPDRTGRLRLRDVIVLSGTNTLFDATQAFDDGLWALAPDRSPSFVFRFRRCARPIIPCALHLFASTGESPMLRTARLLARLEAAREGQSQMPISILVDDDLTPWTKEVLAFATGPASLLEPAAPGQAYRVGSLLYPPTFPAPPSPREPREAAFPPSAQAWFRKAKQSLLTRAREVCGQGQGPRRIYLAPGPHRPDAASLLELSLREQGFGFAEANHAAVAERATLIAEADVIVAHANMDSADLLWPKPGAVVIIPRNELAAETEATVRTCAALAGFRLILSSADALTDVDALAGPRSAGP